MWMPLSAVEENREQVWCALDANNDVGDPHPCCLAPTVLQVAARHVESEGMQGSCTVCLLTINKAAGRLHAANLGDSGFFVLGVRPGGDKVGCTVWGSAVAANLGGSGFFVLGVRPGGDKVGCTVWGSAVAAKLADSGLFVLGVRPGGDKVGCTVWGSAVAAKLGDSGFPVLEVRPGGDKVG